MAVQSELMRTIYAPNVFRAGYRRFASINNIFTPSQKRVIGDGLVHQFIKGGLDNVRGTRNPMADFRNSTSIMADTIKVRWNRDGEDANDFLRLDGTIRTTYYELENITSIPTEDGQKEAVINLTQEKIDQIREDFGSKAAIMRVSERSGIIGTVAATPTNTDGGAYSAGSTTVRIQWGTYGVAIIQRNMVIDIYSTAGTLLFAGAKVDHVDVANEYVFLSRASASSTANFDAVVNGAEIFLSGGRNNGAFSLGEFNKEIIGASDSYIGGKNRSQVANYWLLPTKIRANVTARVVSKQDLDDLGSAMASVIQSRQPYVLRAGIKVEQSLRNAIDAAAFVVFPEGDSREARYANYGAEGVNYQHPVFGTLRIVVDPIMRTNRLEISNISQWMAYHPTSSGSTGVTFLPGENGTLFRRLPSDTSGNGFSLAFQAEAMAFMCDACVKPDEQGVIYNVTG